MDSDGTGSSYVSGFSSKSDTDGGPPQHVPDLSDKRRGSKFRLITNDLPSSMSSLTYKTSGRDGTMSLKCNNVTMIKDVDFGEEDAMVVRMSLDKQFWAVGLSRGTVKFYAVQSDSVEPVYTLQDPQEQLACTDMAFIPAAPNDKPERRHMLVAGYASGAIRFWYYTGPTVQSRLITCLNEERVPRPDDPKIVKDSRNQILALDVSKTGRRLVTGGEDAVIRVYDCAKRKEIGRCQSSRGQDRMDGHVLRIYSIIYHPSGAYDPKYEHIFISGAWDDSIQIWDDRHAHSLWAYIGPHISGTDSLDIDPIQNHIISGSWRREKAIVQVWKFNEDVVDNLMGTMAKIPTQPASRPRRDCEKPLAELLDDGIQCPTMGYVARWMGTQFILYGGSNSNVVKVIDRNTLNTIGSVNDIAHGVYSIAYSEPEPNDKRPHYKFAFCAGSKLFVMRMEKK